MSDKTRLELDIEHRERYRTPVSIKILTFLLFISLCFVGLLTFKLKQELFKKELEINLMKEDFQKEKVELLSKIKKLEAETSSANSN